MKRKLRERPTSLVGRFTLASSEFVNKRGLYAGRRSTKVHVAIYRKTGGRRLATDQEREQLWKKMIATYPGYAFYARNAKGRKIPVVILDPR